MVDALSAAVVSVDWVSSARGGRLGISAWWVSTAGGTGRALTQHLLGGWLDGNGHVLGVLPGDGLHLEAISGDDNGLKGEF